MSASALANADPREGFAAIVAAPFGAIGIRSALGLVTELVYLPLGYRDRAFRSRSGALAARQIERYLLDPEFAFDLPLAPVGTAFQQRVWDAIRQIPCGQVRSYGGIARFLRTAPRAVGQACGANWYPLVIPCHRVVASDGLGGFGGDTSKRGVEDGFQLEIKRWLLRHEGVQIGPLERAAPSDVSGMSGKP
ncbi:MAG: methylated-DNA--[protein]-cysteine S-methyltransferase [Burkholderiaceae bacterium]|jgi:methylated-DNA-[protein]-cysteine S-methyltransferase